MCLSGLVQSVGLGNDDFDGSGLDEVPELGGVYEVKEGKRNGKSGQKSRCSLVVGSLQ